MKIYTRDFIFLLKKRICNGFFLFLSQPAKSGGASLIDAPNPDGAPDDNFAIVFAAMGVNMETARFFKQVSTC